MRKSLVLFLFAALSSGALADTPNPGWNAPCSEWHFTLDATYPIAIWSSTVYSQPGPQSGWGYCFSDRNWPPCNQAPDKLVTMDLTQMGVASDAKEAIFSGLLLISSTAKVNDQSEVKIKFCQPSDPCNMTQFMHYAIGQGGFNVIGGTVGVGSRTHVTLFAPVVTGNVQYIWHYETTAIPTPTDENYGVSLQLAGWCR